MAVPLSAPYRSPPMGNHDPRLCRHWLLGLSPQGMGYFQDPADAEFKGAKVVKVIALTNRSHSQVRAAFSALLRHPQNDLNRKTILQDLWRCRLLGYIMKLGRYASQCAEITPRKFCKTSPLNIAHG